jgi:hypothetical protein
VPSRPTNDTWEFDGSQSRWTHRSIITRPSPRTGHAMGFDAARGRTVLFGGVGADGVALADTWEYSAGSGTWSHVETTGQIPARTGHVLAYDSTRSRMMVVGGLSYQSSGKVTEGFDDVWEYAATTGAWTPLAATAGPAITVRGMTFDSSRNA